MINRLPLQLCARLNPYKEQQEKLKKNCQDLRFNQNFLRDAEEQGVAPLLFYHLSKIEDIDQDIKKGLKFLCLRHRQANTILLSALSDITETLQDKGVEHLLLKGSALANTIYPDPGLRPMRDLDILCRPDSIKSAYKHLQNRGYTPAKTVVADNYHHLPPLEKKLRGLNICVELHRGIFPKDPPYYREPEFDELFNRSSPLTIKETGVTARMMSYEDMLYHLFQHGFRAPLTFEPYRLISVADIIILIESTWEQMDWNFIKNNYPDLYSSLPYFEYFSGWHPSFKKEKIWVPQIAPEQRFKTVSPYCGWPSKQQEDSRGLTPERITTRIRHTLCPDKRWMSIYYGVNGGNLQSRIACCFFTHPAHLLRWLKTDCTNYFKAKKKMCDS